MAAMKETVLLFLFFSFSTVCYGDICDGSNQAMGYSGDCSKFYECVPGQGPVLKSCGEGTMFNTVYRMCDWPQNVQAVRPECRPRTYDQHPMMESSKIEYIYESQPKSWFSDWFG